MQLEPYIFFYVRCEEAPEFYKFWGGKFGVLGDRFGTEWMLTAA